MSDSNKLYECKCVKFILCDNFSEKKIIITEIPKITWKFNLETCTNNNHICICAFQYDKAVLCKSYAHNCICKEWPKYCRSNNHNVCICKFGIKRLNRYFSDFCNCYIHDCICKMEEYILKVSNDSDFKCRSEMHYCNCNQTSIYCLKLFKHKCICGTKNNNEICRAYHDVTRESCICNHNILESNICSDLIKKNIMHHRQYLKNLQDFEANKLNKVARTITILPEVDIPRNNIITVDCDAKTHHCSCEYNMNPEKCLSKYHICICKYSIADNKYSQKNIFEFMKNMHRKFKEPICYANEHNCICHFNTNICKGHNKNNLSIIESNYVNLHHLYKNLSDLLIE